MSAIAAGALRHSRARAADLAVGLSVAVGLLLAERSHGGLQLVHVTDPSFLADRAPPEAVLWGPLGLTVTLAVVVLLVVGRLPSVRVWPSAAVLALLGCWSLASIAWGGLPDDAWRTLDRCVLVAAALVLGSQLASSGRRAEIVLGAVLLASCGQAVEILARISTGTAPGSWAGTSSDALAGPVGYKNTQAAIFAIAVPLALRLVVRQDRRLQATGGAAAGLLLGAMLLSQSRGALAVLVVAVAVQLWWTGSRRLLIFGAALGASALLLDLALMRIPAGRLLAGSPSSRVALYLVAWCAAIGGLAAFAGSAALVLRAARQAVVVPAATAVIAIGGIGVVASHSDFGHALAVSSAHQTGLQASGEGGTHLATLSTNGRTEAWRVAAGLIADHPLAGTGQGGFARRWTIARRTPLLDVLQPHSLALEAFSELGIVGLALLAAFGALLIRGVSRSRHRARVGAGLAVAILIGGQALFDRTWSYPALDAAALLALGAVAGAGRLRALPVAGRLAAVTAGAIALVLVGAPYLSARQIATASALQATDLPAAREHARQARRLDPWSPAAFSMEGHLSEAAGESLGAADLYRRAAHYSRQPWLAYFDEARALHQAGRTGAARAACLQAVRANLDEQLLLTGPCAYDVAGNDWPVVRAGGHGYSSLFRDLGCDSCTVRAAGHGVDAVVPGGPDSRDSAYAVRKLGGRRGVSGAITIRGTVALEPGQNLSGYLDVLEVRDVHHRLVFCVYIHADRTFNVYSPAGGLQAEPFSASTGVAVPAGKGGLRFRITAHAGHTLVLYVNGRRQAAAHLSGGVTSSNPRFLRLGIVWSDSLEIFDEVRVHLSARVS